MTQVRNLPLTQEQLDRTDEMCIPDHAAELEQMADQILAFTPEDPNAAHLTAEQLDARASVEIPSGNTRRVTRVAKGRNAHAL